MLVVASISLGILLAAAICQVIWVRQFGRLFRGTPSQPTDEWPKAAIILCLRGADPSLERCLRGILSQNYPRYEVRVVIDHPDDPSRPVVERVISELGASNVFIQTLHHHRDTCTLKMNALIEAITALDNSTHVVALIDADVRAYPDWLRDLVAPLNESRVGATHGQRWFVPVATNPGTLVRYGWNAGATLQMTAFGIPWGGSLALRMDAIRDCKILEHWAHCFCDDTSLPPLLHNRGLRAKAVGQATMCSYERIDLRNAFTFIRRQMLAARVHHPAWRWVFIFGLSTGAAFGGSVVALAVAVFQHRWEPAAMSVLGLSSYFLVLVGGLFVVEWYIQPLQKARNEPVHLIPWQALAALPLTYAVYLAAMISASWLRHVQWRGITYEVSPRGIIRMLEYRPFVSNVPTGTSLI
ncbi:MAG: glycosyltransferase [Gemmataceae bacterium]